MIDIVAVLSVLLGVALWFTWAYGLMRKLVVVVMVAGGFGFLLGSLVTYFR